MVRKDNTVNYKGNFYTLPTGTYNSEDVQVLIEEKEGKLHISSLDQRLIATHPICLETGKQIRNNNHKRDHSIKLKELFSTIASGFSDRELALQYFSEIKRSILATQGIICKQLKRHLPQPALKQLIKL